MNNEKYFGRKLQEVRSVMNTNEAKNKQTKTPKLLGKYKIIELM